MTQSKLGLGTILSLIAVVIAGYFNPSLSEACKPIDLMAKGGRGADLFTIVDSACRKKPIREILEGLSNQEAVITSFVQPAKDPSEAGCLPNEGVSKSGTEASFDQDCSALLNDVDSIVGRDQYKSIDLSAMATALESMEGEINKGIQKLNNARNFEVDYEESKFESGEERSDRFRKLAKGAVKGVFIDGPFKLMGVGLAAGGKKAYKTVKSVLGRRKKGDPKADDLTEQPQTPLSGSPVLSNEEISPETEHHSEVLLEDLLPKSSQTVAIIRGAKGASMVVVGAAGIAGGVVSLGIASPVVSAAGVGIEITAGLVEKHFQNPSKRKAAFLTLASDQSPDPKADAHHLSLQQSIKDMALIGVEKSGGGVGFAVRQAVTSNSVIPFLGAAWAISQGTNEIYNAIKGTERGHEILREYERAYQAIVETIVGQRQASILEKIKQLGTLSKDRGRLSAQKQRLLISSIHCLCEADAWLSAFSKKAAKKFGNRINYLDNKIKYKETRKNIQRTVEGWLGQTHEKVTRHHMEQALPLLALYRKEIEDEYSDWMNVYSQLKISEVRPEPLRERQNSDSSIGSESSAHSDESMRDQIQISLNEVKSLEEKVNKLISDICNFIMRTGLESKEPTTTFVFNDPDLSEIEDTPEIDLQTLHDGTPRYRFLTQELKEGVEGRRERRLKRRALLTELCKKAEISCP